MKKLFVKICGITRVEDALLVASLGGDAIGFIFYPPSKRFVNNSKAAPIAEAATLAGISRVGVFVNPSLELLETAVREVSLDYLQLHGNETPAFVSEVRVRFPKQKIIKAVRLDSAETTVSYDADFELLDHSSPEWGGTGQIVPWSEAQTYVKRSALPVLLAGGINPSNIRLALEGVNPAGIDLSSGVESSPGVKSEEKLRELFHTLGRGSR
jgi:phosphoribosylanthranilate isomerase